MKCAEGREGNHKMSLAYVQFGIAIFIGLLGTLVGLLMALAILLPVHTAKAEAALSRSPSRCFLVGLGTLILTALAVVMLSVPILRPIGFVGLLGQGAVMSIGMAGIAQLMGKRISEMSGAKTSFGSLVRGSFAFSAGVFFPLLGWYLLAPIAGVCSLGAGVMAFVPVRRTATLPPLHGMGGFEGQGAM